MAIFRALHCSGRGPLAGDFFVDCTGFAALLDRQDTSACRSKTAATRCSSTTQSPCKCLIRTRKQPVACHTIATASDAGWIWDIGLPTRRGVGHVYSSRHMSHDEAVAALHRYIGPAAANLPMRTIKIRSGHRERFWVRNCVAIGLSAGFLEPLEASALLLVEHSVDFLAERLPANPALIDTLSAQFNRTFAHHWDRIVEFLKLHYALSKREDTAFWRDNRDPATVPTDLKERLRVRGVISHRARRTSPINPKCSPGQVINSSCTACGSRLTTANYPTSRLKPLERSAASRPRREQRTSGLQSSRGTGSC